MNTISFVVLGLPQTAGSKKSIPIKNRSTGEWVTRDNGSTLTVTVDDNPKSKHWKAAVAWEAKKVYQGPLLTGPLHVAFTFFMPRPAGHYGSGSRANQLKPSSPRWPITRPDVLKLSRAAEDGLTNVIWRDDSQIADARVIRCYRETPGADVRIEEMTT